eukprot:1357110-Pleurochrysis_carterae.AAC.1
MAEARAAALNRRESAKKEQRGGSADLETSDLRGGDAEIVEGVPGGDGGADGDEVPAGSRLRARLTERGAMAGWFAH